jgi:hypothetical protein
VAEVARFPSDVPSARTDAATLPAGLPATVATRASAAAAVRRAASPAGTRPRTGLPTQRGRRAVPPSAPLGSLATAPTLPGCPRCAGTSVTRVAMTLADGAPVTFASCHTCETRGWYAADGAALALPAVLAGASRG